MVHPLRSTACGHPESPPSSRFIAAMPFPTSDHCDGTRFLNPWANTDKSVSDLLRWRRERNRSGWPQWAENAPCSPPPATVADNQIALTHIGHATFLIRIGAVTLLTDPVFSGFVGPLSWLGTRRVRAPGLALEALPPVDLVLLSHNHYDHMDLPSLRAVAQRWRPPIATGLGNGRALTAKGIEGGVELDWWQCFQPCPGVTVHLVPASHWSRRGLFDRRKTLWGGFVVETPAGRVYFAGDTGYAPHFAAIGRRLGPPDIALLPIGAYEPRWFMASQHINPEEAVRAHLDLGAGLSIAMHHATFPLADEAMAEPVAALGRARTTLGVSDQAFRVLDFGETLVWSGDIALASGGRGFTPAPHQGHSPWT
ncbi:N-acyl-phosphatidylethanolamine-hydrolysing phospholipase D [uncultured Gammaproteobacteria bacterium]